MDFLKEQAGKMSGGDNQNQQRPEGEQGERKEEGGAGGFFNKFGNKMYVHALWLAWGKQ